MITNLKQYIKNFGNVNETLEITHGYKLHLIEAPGPETPFGIVGEFGYKTEFKTGYRTQHFIMTHGEGDDLQSVPIDVKEITMIIRLSKAVEEYFKDLKTTVVDVRLPKSHHWSGTKMLYKQLKAQYKSLA
ncbi:MAG: hypothetical protein IBX57_00715 [Gammaproteobacteria bacterium]|nr:hypothetical protein [Gammaproteobacteria bacterium]